MNISTHEMIFRMMENWAPKKLAYDWDNVGLQVGSKSDKTKGILVSLDVNEQVVDEAIQIGANLIISHHPLIFKPIKNIDFNSVKGKLLRKIIKSDITIYASHTNLDIAKGGVNDLLAEKLQLNNTEPLVVTDRGKLYKLVVFTPINHVTQVVNTLSNSGAGHIGNYSHCTFQSEGTGTFMPLSDANPYIGRQHELENVEEIKIETIVKDIDLTKTISAMKKAHPYEEVAYDIIALENSGEKLGIGRIGNLSEQISLKQLVQTVKSNYELNFLRVIGDLTKSIRKVAIVGGSGEKFVDVAHRMGADVLITGDVTFHIAQEAKDIGLAVIDAGHYIEKIMINATKVFLKEHFQQLKINESQTNTDPFQFL